MKGFAASLQLEARAQTGRRDVNDARNIANC